MFCRNCGSNIPDNAPFCPNCGTATGAGQQQQQYQQPPQQQYQTPQQQYQQYGQQNYNQQQYGQQYQQQYQQPYGPARKLNTSRGLLKFILLSIITFGIYAIVYFSSISESINIAASRYDGKKTMHFCLLCFLVGPITFQIATLVWIHKVSNRIGCELNRRGIAYSFGASTYWLWAVLGSMIVIGPFVYLHKLSRAMNLICEDYNARG